MIRRPPHLDVDPSVDVCPICELRYDDFRTGLTFKQVRDQLYVASEDSEDWVYKRRHTVLGRWRMLKLEMWEDHLILCAVFDDDYAAGNGSGRG